MRILLVYDSEPAELSLIRQGLARDGHTIDSSAYADVVEDRADLLIAFTNDESCRDHVSILATALPGTEIITVGAENDSFHADVLENLAPPVDLERLAALVREVANIVGGERSRAPLDLVAWETLAAGDSHAVRTLVRRIRLVARASEPVWISAQDGCGRPLVARAIHDRSSRRDEPFVAFNVAMHSDDELCDLVGAARGTLFLDQIASAGPRLQRELSRLLDRAREDLGPPRIIVGTQPDTSAAAFAQDLFYRLKVLEVDVPALKERAADLGAIVERMLDRFTSSSGQRPTISSEAVDALARYSFPGNLLELAHALTHAVVLAHRGSIEAQHLPAAIRSAESEVSRDIAATFDKDNIQPLDSVAKQFEREYLIRVLRSVGGSRVRAAEILGLSRKGLWGKLKSHGISDDDIEDFEAANTPGVLVEGPWKGRKA